MYVVELTRSLLEFQKAGYLCDTVIVVDDGQLRAHSAVLAAASPLFKGVLKVDASAMEHTVIMPGIQLSVAEVIVEYMYTGNFEVEGQCIDYEQVDRLQQAIQEFVINLHVVTQENNSVEENAKTSEEVNQINTESLMVDAVVPTIQSAEKTDHSVVALAAKSRPTHICDPLTGKGHATVRQALACRRRAKGNEIEVSHTNIESQTTVQAKKSTEPTDNSKLQVAAISYHICDPLTGKGHAAVGQAFACRRSNRKRYISAKVDLDEMNVHYNLASLYGTRTDSDRRRPKDPCPCGVEEENLENGTLQDNDGNQVEPPVAHGQKGPCTCAAGRFLQTGRD